MTITSLFWPKCVASKAAHKNPMSWSESRPRYLNLASVSLTMAIIRCSGWNIYDISALTSRFWPTGLQWMFLILGKHVAMKWWVVQNTGQPLSVSCLAKRVIKVLRMYQWKMNMLPLEEIWHSRLKTVKWLVSVTFVWYKHEKWKCHSYKHANLHVNKEGYRHEKSINRNEGMPHYT